MQQHPEVVDLGNVRARLEAAETARAVQEGEEATERLRQFETSMQRAFKGIVPRPARISLLRTAVARYEAEHGAES